MTASWVLSPLAFEDLDSILDYIVFRSRSLSVAEKAQQHFFGAFGKLADAPGIGYVKQELTGDNVRWWRVHDYLVLYDPESSPLRILRIVHGARDLPRLFDE